MLATLDTRTSLIAMPTHFAEYLNRNIGAKEVSGGLYEVDCRKRNQLPDPYIDPVWLEF